MPSRSKIRKKDTAFIPNLLVKDIVTGKIKKQIFPQDEVQIGICDCVGTLRVKKSLIVECADATSVMSGNLLLLGDLTGSDVAMNEQRHKELKHLIHFIDEGPADGFLTSAYKEVTPFGSVFPTAVTWYTDSSKGFKVVEKLISRTGSGSNTKPTPITWNMYTEDGVSLIATVVDDITYSGVTETTRTRTITEW